jgi:hypothetical protein
MQQQIAPDSVTDVLDKVRAALPDPEVYGKDEVRVINMLITPGQRGKMNTVIYTVIFLRAHQDGKCIWVLKDIETQIPRLAEDE